MRVFGIVKKVKLLLEFDVNFAVKPMANGVSLWSKEAKW